MDSLTKVDRYTAQLAAASHVALLDSYERAVRQLAKADFGSELWDDSRQMVEIARTEVVTRLAAR